MPGLTPPSNSLKRSSDCYAAARPGHDHRTASAPARHPVRGAGGFRASCGSVARVQYASRVSGTRDAAGSATFHSRRPVLLNDRTATGHYDAARGATSRPPLSASHLSPPAARALTVRAVVCRAGWSGRLSRICRVARVLTGSGGFRRHVAASEEHRNGNRGRGLSQLRRST